MQTVLNTLQFILQFSLGALLGTLVWHNAGALLSRVLTSLSRPRTAKPAAPSTQYRISGPNLEEWPINRVILQSYGIAVEGVLDAKRVTVPLTAIEDMPAELADTVRGLHAEGRAPGVEMARWIGGEAPGNEVSLVLVLRKSANVVPETWLLLAPSSSGGGNYIQETSTA